MKVQKIVQKALTLLMKETVLYTVSKVSAIHKLLIIIILDRVFEWIGTFAWT